MEEFSIKGNGDFLKITFEEVYGLPEGICALGGYEVRATLEIRSRGFQVKADLFTATGEIYAFYKQLKGRNDGLIGVVDFRTYEGNLDLKLEYDSLGQIKVKGSFSEQNDFANKLEFEFHTDQTYLNSTLNELKAIVDKYGGRRGIKK